MATGVSEAAVNVVENSTGTIESEVNNMEYDASAGDILEATCNINDATNQASAATAATQKEDQLEQQAVSTLK